MSKNLLKEAIADAKAVRETAIANAKLALEEAFTPKLQSMLSTKISEDMYEDEEEEVDGMDMAMGDDSAADLAINAGEEELDVTADEVPGDEFADEVPGEEDEEALEIEAIIRELEGEDEEEIPAPEDDEEVFEAATSDSVGTKESNDELKEEDELTEDEINLDEIIKSLEEDGHDDEEEVKKDDDDELKEAYATIKSLQSTLQEVNLLNAKLLFSNKLFKSNNLSETQKVKVIETFDRAANLREVKLVYTTLNESFSNRAPKGKIAEGLASKSIKSTKPAKKAIVESNELANRMKHLAGLL
jgi:hypothetical protein